MTSSLLRWMFSGSLGKSSAASTSNDGMGRPFSLMYLSSFAVSLLMISASSVMVAACPPMGATLSLSVVLPPVDDDLAVCLSLTGL